MATPNLGNGDNFLAKYNSSGQQLWLKQWGTVNKDTGYALATDAAGNVYVSGYTTGPLYGTSPLGNRDYFLAKYDAAGNLLWGKHDGTSGHDQGWGAATDAAGNVYVAGETGGSLNGNAYQGLLDVFLTKYDPAGTRLWTAQYGTADDDLARGVAVGTNGTVYRGRLHRGQPGWECQPGSARAIRDEVRPGHDRDTSTADRKAGDRRDQQRVHGKLERRKRRAWLPP